MPQRGLLEPGNIDLRKQPKVKNPNGGTSTVFSSSYNLDGREVLLPAVTPDGRFLATEQQVLDEYRRTGRHLGIFDTPENATAYAEQLHNDYAAGKYEPMPPQTLAQLVRAKYPGAYDQVSDQELERAVRAKFPGVYDHVPSTPAPAAAAAPLPSKVPPQTLSHAAAEAWKQANPVSMVKGLGHAVLHPVQTATGMYNAQMEQFDKAGTELAEGRTSEGLGHLAAGVIPIVGPAAAAIGEQGRDGDVAGMVGAGLGLVGSVFAPRAVKAVTPTRATVRVLPRVVKPNLNPAEQAAVAFGESKGIPIDAATATGNRFVRGVQKVADESLLGSRRSATNAQTEALTRTGRELAGRANPTPRGRAGAPADPVSAGQAVSGRLERRINAQARVADRAYGELRALEAQRAPAGSRGVPLAVNVGKAKQTLRPLYDSLMRESELTTLQGGKARTLVALDRLMNGPDLAPLSDVDAALGDLKSMARTDDLPALRTQGQASAAEVVKGLEAEVMAAAQRGGRDVVAALKGGRQATIGKYETAGVRDLLSVDEPAKVFQQLTQQKDLGLERLRNVAEQTPREIPTIARAYIDGLMDTATAEGGFGHAQKLWSEWEKLGPETKKILFKDPAYIQDLDRFFLLAKNIAENPNPSGTAWTFTKSGELTLLMTNPVKGLPASLGLGALSKLLHSPTGVRVLTRGLSASVPLRSAATRATRAGLVGSMGRAAVPAPTAAGNRADTPARSAQR